MVECRLNDTSLQDADIRKALRRVRLLYVVFLATGLLGSGILIVLPLETEELVEAAQSLWAICYLASLGLLAVALRYALDCAWARVAGMLGGVLCAYSILVLPFTLGVAGLEGVVLLTPIISMILLIPLDLRLSVAAKKTPVFPTSLYTSVIFSFF